jgi:hypothetical protein
MCGTARGGNSQVEGTRFRVPRRIGPATRLRGHRVESHGLMGYATFLGYRIVAPEAAAVGSGRTRSAEPDDRTRFAALATPETRPSDVSRAGLAEHHGPACRCLAPAVKTPAPQLRATGVAEGRRHRWGGNLCAVVVKLAGQPSHEKLVLIRLGRRHRGAIRKVIGLRSRGNVGRPPRFFAA